jgi:hypothetical protein
MHEDLDDGAEKCGNCGHEYVKHGKWWDLIDGGEYCTHVDDQGHHCKYVKLIFSNVSPLKVL